jgi:hypothetical protein
MPALVAGIHVFLPFGREDVDGRDDRTFTPVFDGLCPAMTKEIKKIARRETGRFATKVDEESTPRN